MRLESWLKSRNPSLLGSNVKVKWGINYTFLNTSHSSGEVSKYLADHPQHNLNFMLAFQSSVADLSFYSQWIQRNEESVAAINANIEPNYSVSHLSLALKPLGDEFSFYVKVHNLFDAEYQEVLGAQMPGRWLMGGIRWNLARK